MKNMSWVRLTLICGLMLVSVSARAITAPVLLTDKEMLTDRAQKIAPDGEHIVFVDHQGKLLTSKLDGTGRKVLTATGPGDNDRVLALVRDNTEFAVVTEGAATFVYFQGRESPSSFKVYFYKVNLDGSAKPAPLFSILRPFTHVIASSKGDLLYLAGAKHILFNVATGARQELPVQPLYANQFTLSSDFHWVIYTAQRPGTPGSPPVFELRSFDLISKQERTLLQDLDRFFLVTELSTELGLLAVFRPTGSTHELLLISLEGNDIRRVYPLPGNQATIQPGVLFFLKGIRGDGDAGRLMFSFRDQGGSSRLFAADLNDLTVEKIPTGEVEGEEISAFRVTPDSKTLIFQRGLVNAPPSYPGAFPTDPFRRVTSEGKTYSLDLVKPDARPVFLYQSAHMASILTSSAASVVYISTGSFFPVNELILVSLDGHRSVRLSEKFDVGWLKAGESLSMLAVAGTYGVVSVNTGQSPGQFRLLSFVIDEKAPR